MLPLRSCSDAWLSQNRKNQGGETRFFQSLNSDLSERRTTPIRNQLLPACVLVEAPNTQRSPPLFQLAVLLLALCRRLGNRRVAANACPGASKRSARAESIVNTMRRRRGATGARTGAAARGRRRRDIHHRFVRPLK